MKAYAAPVEQVIAEYGSDPKGLSSQEAACRLEKYGKNKLEEKKIRKIINEFKRGKCINNDFLKEIIDKIEIYSKDRIEITFNL